MNLAQMRTRLRQDLHDEDAANQRWSDAELDRHIGRALRELSLAIPLEAKAALTTVAGSRDLSIASLTDMVAVEAVEYPTGKYPPSYVSFALWAATLTLLIDREPAGGEAVNVYYDKMHTLDAASSTIPPQLEEVMATGGAAYAALEWASFAANRVNVGGQDVWRRYLTWGQERLATFARALARYSRRNALRARRLYTPAAPPAGPEQPGWP